MRDIAALAAIAGTLVREGNSLMVTPSRRTPPGARRGNCARRSPRRRPIDAFVWDGSGDNPYLHMLAHADAILVTADSVNMVGEAAATGAPVHIYEPTGSNPKIDGFIDKLVAQGAARRWRGTARTLDLSADRCDRDDCARNRRTLCAVQADHAGL